MSNEEHDLRCISRTDSEFNGNCDCRTLKAMDDLVTFLIEEEIDD